MDRPIYNIFHIQLKIKTKKNPLTFRHLFNKKSSNNSAENLLYNHDYQNPPLPRATVTYDSASKKKRNKSH